MHGYQDGNKIKTEIVVCPFKMIHI